MRLRAALCLVLTLAAAPASGATLYRWMDPDGREAIGTTPPPGVEAVLWTPGQPSAPPAAPAGPPAAADDPAAPAAVPAKAPAALRAAAEREERCQRQLERTREARAAMQRQEAEIEALEAKLARLQASEVAYSRTDCLDAYTRSDIECTSEVFDRDKEISRVESSLAKAHEKVDDLELAARAPDAECE